MKTQYTGKREYEAPIINQVLLDHEISLALESTPPTYETQNCSNAPDYFNNNPFKSIKV
jgi:hypothetical protein